MTLPFFKPRFMLGVYLGLCFIFCLAATTTTGKASVAMLILVLCFESVSSPRQFWTIIRIGPMPKISLPIPDLKMIRQTLADTLYRCALQRSSPSVYVVSEGTQNAVAASSSQPSVAAQSFQQWSAQSPPIPSRSTTPWPYQRLAISYLWHSLSI